MNIEIEKVEKVVAEVFNADIKWFYVKARYAEVIEARAALFWILMRIGGISSTKLQKRYGLHNSTIRHAGYVAQVHIDSDITFKKKIQKIKKICFKR